MRSSLSRPLGLCLSLSEHWAWLFLARPVHSPCGKKGKPPSAKGTALKESPVPRNFPARVEQWLVPKQWQTEPVFRLRQVISYFYLWLPWLLHTFSPLSLIKYFILRQNSECEQVVRAVAFIFLGVRQQNHPVRVRVCWGLKEVLCDEKDMTPIDDS